MSEINVLTMKFKIAEFAVSCSASHLRASGPTKSMLRLQLELGKLHRHGFRAYNAFVEETSPKCTIMDFLSLNRLPP